MERVGRHDNFFALGGHSLLAITLIERMRRNGLAVDVRTLFATPTLADLAAGLGAAPPAIAVPPNLIPFGCEAILPQMLPLLELTQQEIDGSSRWCRAERGNVQDIYPLAPLQEGILFHHLMSSEGDPYLLAVEMSFDSRERLDSYIEAQRLSSTGTTSCAAPCCGRVCRSRCRWSGARRRSWWKRSHSSPTQAMWPDSCTLASIRVASASMCARRPGCDLRIAYDPDHDRWLMLQLLHHLAGDHTTLEVMQAEVQAHLLGQADQLPAPLPFRNLVAQARLGVSREEHETFFRRDAGDVDEPTAPFGLLDVQGDGAASSKHACH